MFVALRGRRLTFSARLLLYGNNKVYLSTRSGGVARQRPVNSIHVAFPSKIFFLFLILPRAELKTPFTYFGHYRRDRLFVDGSSELYAVEINHRNQCTQGANEPRAFYSARTRQFKPGKKFAYTDDIRPFRQRLYRQRHRAFFKIIISASIPLRSFIDFRLDVHPISADCSMHQ